MWKPVVELEIKVTVLGEMCIYIHSICQLHLHYIKGTKNLTCFMFLNFWIHFYSSENSQPVCYFSPVSSQLSSQSHRIPTSQTTQTIDHRWVRKFVNRDSNRQFAFTSKSDLPAGVGFQPVWLLVFHALTSFQWSQISAVKVLSSYWMEWCQNILERETENRY